MPGAQRATAKFEHCIRIIGLYTISMSSDIDCGFRFLATRFMATSLAGPCPFVVMNFLSDSQFVTAVGKQTLSMDYTVMLGPRDALFDCVTHPKSYLCKCTLVRASFRGLIFEQLRPTLELLSFWWPWCVEQGKLLLSELRWLLPAVSSST